MLAHHSMVHGAPAPRCAASPPHPHAAAWLHPGPHSLCTMRKGEERGGVRGRYGRVARARCMLYRAQEHLSGTGPLYAAVVKEGRRAYACLPSRRLPPPSQAARPATWRWPWLAPAPARPPLARKRRPAPRRAPALRAPGSAQPARRCARTWRRHGVSMVLDSLSSPRAGPAEARWRRRPLGVASRPLGSSSGMRDGRVPPERHPEAIALSYYLPACAAGWWIAVWCFRRAARTG